MVLIRVDLFVRILREEDISILMVIKDFLSLKIHYVLGLFKITSIVD